jgi:hypothetical protein
MSRIRIGLVVATLQRDVDTQDRATLDMLLQLYHGKRLSAHQLMCVLRLVGRRRLAAAVAHQMPHLPALLRERERGTARASADRPGSPV